MGEQPHESSSPPLPDIDSLWNYNDPAGTEAAFRALLPRVGSTWETHSYALELFTQLARTQSLQRKYDECHTILNEVDREATVEMHRVRVRSALERGRAFNDTGKLDDAKRCFAAAWDLARAQRLDGLAVDAAHMLAIAASGKDAVEWNLRAIAFAEASADPAARRWFGSLRNNLGWAYVALARYPEALAQFEEVVRVHAAANRPGPLRVGRYSVAKTLRLVGRVDESLTLQRQVLRDAEAQGEPDGYVHEELGECLLALGRPDEARAQFARAWELLSMDPWFPNDEAARLERIRRLATGEGETS
jgi:tetratricopeptide (TPR) repeat protein